MEHGTPRQHSTQQKTYYSQIQHETSSRTNTRLEHKIFGKKCVIVAVMLLLLLSKEMHNGASNEMESGRRGERRVYEKKADD